MSNQDAINSAFELPIFIKISFHKLLEQYEELAKSEDEYIANHAKRVIEIGNENPILREGFSDPNLIYKYQKEIGIILQDSFSEILTNNEIKAASVPFHDLIFNSSARFKKIILSAGDDYQPVMRNIPDEYRYIISCLIILSLYYKYPTSYTRPFFYEIPDANGLMRYYRILYNADFTEIIKNENAPEITQEDYELLLDNFDNIELWKKKFPLHSYTMTGFIISNIFDVTDDQSISKIKSTLIGDLQDKEDVNHNEIFDDVFRTLLNIPDLKVGLSMYNAQEDSFERPYGNNTVSFLLNGKEVNQSSDSLCHKSYKTILKDRQFYAISDVDKMNELAQGKAPQYRAMKEQGIKSFILAPVADENELLGVIELVSPTPKVLNSINAYKLVIVLPFILSAVQRIKKEEQNLIAAIIQQECTSIHSSVQWRFVQEAKQFIREQYKDGKAAFGKVAFQDIYPLFGQMDIKGSSAKRNQATKDDLGLQLKLAKSVIQEVNQEKPLPIYDQLIYQMNLYISEIEHNFQVDTEQRVNRFIQDKIQDLLKHLSEQKPLEKLVDKYNKKIDQKLNMVYRHRKDYDDAVAQVNVKMAEFIDAKQEQAQAMYPHYFERYKTDGIEHNMYIGESITKEDSFNPIYLYNLRLWQLQMMCEMENTFYAMKDELPVPLDVASMILVFNQPLTISFRTDEKHFDVDGMYNARYEIVKKRVDKALIKGTNERLTIPGKMSIVYSQKHDEQEYMRYVQFLQSKNYLGDEVEVLELQDLQSVTGLKAIRVNILYHQKETEDKLYTYEDLMKEIE